eukprot:NODE_452_length_7258_cov_0.721050.p1 type:complete len:662 gc:universal NODE_452_length_7258_cov_0.721050:1495-3480(+)
MSSHLIQKQNQLIQLLYQQSQENNQLTPQITQLYNQISQLITQNHEIQVRISIVHHGKVGFIIDYTSGVNHHAIFKSVDQIWYFCALLQKHHKGNKSKPLKSQRPVPHQSNSSLTLSSHSIAQPMTNLDLKLIKFPEKQILLTNDPHMMDKRRKQVDEFLKSLIHQYPNEHSILDFLNSDFYTEESDVKSIDYKIDKSASQSLEIHKSTSPSTHTMNAPTPNSNSQSTTHLNDKSDKSDKIEKSTEKPAPENPDEVIIGKSGYLMKFSRGKWKPRFYILEQDGLYGHKDNHRHMITFKSANICLLTDYLRDPIAQQIASTLLMEQVPNVLVIHYNNHAQYLKCHSSYDRDSWFRAIQLALGEYNKRPKFFRWFTTDKSTKETPGNPTNQNEKFDKNDKSTSLQFGVPLIKCTANSLLPPVIFRCIEYLDTKQAYLEEGIYRLSGSTNTIKQLKDAFNKDGDVNLLVQYPNVDVHAVAGLLKLWFRELPENILSNLIGYFNKCNDLDKQSKTVECRKLVNLLDLPYYTLLRGLIAHLRIITNYSENNKMTISNIGIVFAPTLNISAGLFCHFIQYFEDIFMDLDIGNEDETQGSEQKDVDSNGELDSTGSYLDIPMDMMKPDELEMEHLEIGMSKSRNSQFTRNSLIYEDKSFYIHVVCQIY